MGACFIQRVGEYEGFGSQRIQPIGLLVIQTLRAVGCGKIIAIDIEPEKLDLARQLGADFTLNSSEAKVVSTAL